MLLDYFRYHVKFNADHILSNLHAVSLISNSNNCLSNSLTYGLHRQKQNLKTVYITRSKKLDSNFAFVLMGLSITSVLQASQNKPDKCELDCMSVWVGVTCFDGEQLKVCSSSNVSGKTKFAYVNVDKSKYIGPQGIQGAIGPAGLQGPIGASGINGLKGWDWINWTTRADRWEGCWWPKWFCKSAGIEWSARSPWSSWHSRSCWPGKAPPDWIPSPQLNGMGWIHN